MRATDYTETMSPELEVLKNTGIALAAGLLIGLERGWSSRSREEGVRIAGLRTFGLVGLSGGLWGLLSGTIGITLLGFGFLGLSLLVVTAYLQRDRETEDVGITSAVALLLTFVLGAVAVTYNATLAAACAVIVTLLLGFKPILHAWINKLRREELYATLKLLLISVVLLPILPNRGYGPWQALNPYQIWWMVVLIAALSYVGYFAIRIAGARRGMLLTGIFGGLAASTAVTLILSRLGRDGSGIRDALAAGILAACATMFPRALLIASALNPELLVPLVAPMLAMALVTYLAALVFWRRSRRVDLPGDLHLGNPFQMATALKFGALLTAILLLSRVAQGVAGDAGIYALAATSGIADVDAITLTLSRMSPATISLDVAIQGIVIATLMNSLVKAGITLFIGGIQLGTRVGIALVSAIVLGMLFLQ